MSQLELIVPTTIAVLDCFASVTSFIILPTTCFMENAPTGFTPVFVANILCVSVFIILMLSVSCGFSHSVKCFCCCCHCQSRTQCCDIASSSRPNPAMFMDPRSTEEAADEVTPLLRGISRESQTHCRLAAPGQPPTVLLKCLTVETTMNSDCDCHDMTTMVLLRQPFTVCIT